LWVGARDCGFTTVDSDVLQVLFSTLKYWREEGNQESIPVLGVIALSQVFGVRAGL